MGSPFGPTAWRASSRSGSDAYRARCRDSGHTFTVFVPGEGYFSYFESAFPCLGSRIAERGTLRGPVSDELFAPGCYLHSEQRLNLSQVH